MPTLPIVRAVIRKDFRSMAGFLAVLIMSSCAYLVFFLHRDDVFAGNTTLRMFSFLFIEPVQYILLPAFLFSIAFNLEWNSGARYQLLTLPARRWPIMLGKPVAVLATALLMIGMFVYLSRVLNPISFRIFQTSYWFSVLWIFSFTVFGVCAAAYAIGFSMVFRRYRFTAWFFAFLGIVYVSYAIVFDRGRIHIGILWIISAVVFAAGLALFTRFVDI